IVYNQGGGGTIIGTEAVARSAPDGYTLLWMTTPFAINHTLFAKRPYDTFEDFIPVVDVISVPLVLIVPSNSPAKTLQDLIAMAKKRSEEHTSELQSREKLVCRLLLDKKNNPTRCSLRHHNSELTKTASSSTARCMA